MSTITRTEKRVTISSERMRFRELVMTRLAKDSPFNIKVKKETNDIVLRRASEIDFEEFVTMLTQDAIKAQEPITVIDTVESTETTITPYKYWYYWGQKMASSTTRELPEE